MALAAYQSTITDDSGTVVPGATIEVRAETAGLPLVQMYSDRDGLVALGNPYVTSDGNVLFYVDGGSYRIKATSGGLIRELKNVAIGTAAENDIEELAALLSGVVNDTTPQLGGVLDTNEHQVRWSSGADVASASELVLGDDGNSFDVTGTADVDSIATKGVGTFIGLRAVGVFKLKNSANLICPGGADITTAAGDKFVIREYDTAKWEIWNYQHAANIVGMSSAPDVILYHKVASGVGGGASVSNTWTTRPINTIERDPKGYASLSSNGITLAAGNYYLTIDCPGYRVGRHRIRLQNTTAAATLLTGLTAAAFSNEGSSTAKISGCISIAASQVLEVQHHTQRSDSEGFGSALSTGDPEIHLFANFWKV